MKRSITGIYSFSVIQWVKKKLTPSIHRKRTLLGMKSLVQTTSWVCKACYGEVVQWRVSLRVSGFSHAIIIPSKLRTHSSVTAAVLWDTSEQQAQQDNLVLLSGLLHISPSTWLILRTQKEGAEDDRAAINRVKEVGGRVSIGFIWLTTGPLWLLWHNHKHSNLESVGFSWQTWG
jgi:hypothetical protein